MNGMGTVVNVLAIIVGSLIGLGVGNRLPVRVQNLLIKAAGLVTLGIGIKMFLKTEQVLIVLLSLVLGGIVGEWLRIEKLLESFGNRIKSTIRSDSPMFLDGFVTASLLYCVGPMAVLGSLADGIGGQHEILFTKSILDGSVSIAFAASLGVGVLFSAITVLVYQGALTALAMLAGSFISGAMVTEITATGGLLIFGIGLNLLGFLKDEKRLPVGNLLPAIAVAAALMWLWSLI